MWGRSHGSLHVCSLVGGPVSGSCGGLRLVDTVALPMGLQTPSASSVLSPTPPSVTPTLSPMVGDPSHKQLPNPHAIEYAGKCLPPGAWYGSARDKYRADAHSHHLLFSLYYIKVLNCLQAHHSWYCQLSPFSQFSMSAPFPIHFNYIKYFPGFCYAH